MLACTMLDEDKLDNLQALKRISHRLPHLWRTRVHMNSPLTFACSSVIVWWLIRHDHTQEALEILRRYAWVAASVLGNDNRQQPQPLFRVSRDFHAHHDPATGNAYFDPIVAPSEYDHVGMRCIVSYEMLLTLVQTRTLYMYIDALLRYGHLDAFFYAIVETVEWKQDQHKLATVLTLWLRDVVELQASDQMASVIRTMSLVTLRILNHPKSDTAGLWKSIDQAFQHVLLWHTQFQLKQKKTSSSETIIITTSPVQEIGLQNDHGHGPHHHHHHRLSLQSVVEEQRAKDKEEEEEEIVVVITETARVTARVTEEEEEEEPAQEEEEEDPLQPPWSFTCLALAC